MLVLVPPRCCRGPNKAWPEFLAWPLVNFCLLRKAKSPGWLTLWCFGWNREGKDSQACGRMSPWLIIGESKNTRPTCLALLKKPQNRAREEKEPAWRRAGAGTVEAVATSREGVFVSLVGRREGE